MTDPLDAVSWPLRTERLVIRRYRPEDADRAWTYRQLPEVVDGITAAPATLDEFRAYATTPSRMSKTLVVELAGAEPESDAGEPATMIGDIMVLVEDGWAQAEVAEQAHNTQAELGWVLDPEFGGRGYATEAARARGMHRFERGILAPHGTGGNAARGVQPRDRPAPLGPVGRRHELRTAVQRMGPCDRDPRHPVSCWSVFV
jgi:RimJ/RimL family protein N-acetyltransferase